MGHWGTHAARPARHHDRYCSRGYTPDPEAGLPPPNTAECALCETVVIIAGKELPKGWVLVDGGAICPDCDAVTTRQKCPPPASDRTAPEQSAPMMERSAEHAVAGARDSRFQGCRVGHEIALGFAALQIRAGAMPPLGRDEAISFMLDAHGLDQLIIELSVIRAELVASQTPGTAAREGAAANG